MAFMQGVKISKTIFLVALEKKPCIFLIKKHNFTLGILYTHETWQLARLPTDT